MSKKQGEKMKGLNKIQSNHSYELLRKDLKNMQRKEKEGDKIVKKIVKALYDNGDGDAIKWGTEWIEQAIDKAVEEERKRIIDEIESRWTGVVIKNKCYYRISMEDWKAIKEL